MIQKQLCALEWLARSKPQKAMLTVVRCPAEKVKQGANIKKENKSKQVANKQDLPSLAGKKIKK